MDHADRNGRVAAEQQDAFEIADRVGDLVEVVGKGEDEGDFEKFARLDGAEGKLDPRPVIGTRTAGSDEEGQQVEPEGGRYIELPQLGQLEIVEF